MFKYIPIKEQLLTERSKNAKLEAENKELAANVDYIAMMSDIELDDEVEEVSEDEQEV